MFKPNLVFLFLREFLECLIIWNRIFLYLEKKIKKNHINLECYIPTQNVAAPFSMQQLPIATTMHKLVYEIEFDILCFFFFLKKV